MYCLKKEGKTKRLNNSRNISYRKQKEKSETLHRLPTIFSFGECWGSDVIGREFVRLCKLLRNTWLFRSFNGILRFEESLVLEWSLQESLVAKRSSSWHKTLLSKQRHLECTWHLRNHQKYQKKLRWKPPKLLSFSVTKWHLRMNVTSFGDLPRVLSLSVYAIGKAVECL